MFTASASEWQPLHSTGLCLLRNLQYLKYFWWMIFIYLDKGSIFNKGQGKKLSDMGPPYFRQFKPFLILSQTGPMLSLWLMVQDK